MATMQVVVIMFGLFPASHPRNPVHETQREVSHACPSEFQHCLAKPTPLYDSHSSLLVASEPFHNVRLLSQLLRLMEPHNTKPQVQNKLVNAMRRLVRLQIKHLLCIEMYACSHPFFFSACFIHTYTHTHTRSVFPSPLLSVFILARPRLRGESGPYWDFYPLPCAKPVLPLGSHLPFTNSRRALLSVSSA